MRTKVSMYADDAILFLCRDEDFGMVNGVLEAFSDATGACINHGKSAVLYTGACDGLKILGVVFWREGSAQKNWDIALGKVQGRANSWRKRDLSLTRRVVLACSRALTT